MKNSTFYLTLRRWWVGYKLVFKAYSYLNTTGFIKSHQLIQPINQLGQPIPWMNYALVELLDERLSKEIHLFEYGAGFSSLYFAERVKTITSIEYDQNWIEKLKELLQGVQNHKLIFTPVGDEYIHAAKNESQVFDLILVDGRERVACAKSGFDALSETGVLILDDSDRQEYQAVFDYAKSLNFKQLRISGLKPFSFKREESTIFYRNENCLNL